MRAGYCCREWIVFVGVAAVLSASCNSNRAAQDDEPVAVTSQALTTADCPAGYNIIQGTSGNDTINGTSGNDCIISLGGDDTIHGNGGNDYIAGGNGDDHIYGDGGNDQLFGEGGLDTIEGGDGNDTISGGASADTLNGNAGDDTISGDAGADIIDGGDGNDNISGGDTDDTIHGGIGNDIIHGDGANDHIYGDDGDDILDGDANADTIYGGNGDDVIYGDIANDTLYGEAGDDALIGGAGTNTSDGGPGTDACTGVNCEKPEMTLSGCTTNAQCSSGKHCIADFGLCIGCVSDQDNDATCDSKDGCPTDAAKTAPGVCGCGTADTDSDSDGTPNCNDGCPNNAPKTAPGVCGCAVADTDSDSDGTANCVDGCPSDPTKTAPGACGCGVPDSDGDGVCDPADVCPGGNDHQDSDSDGTPDACDLTPIGCVSGATGAAIFNGNLVVDGTDTAGDLAQLSGKVCVTGNLTVNGTTLTDLSGLASLREVGGQLTIGVFSGVGNAQLTSLHGLEQLSHTGSLIVGNNYALTSVSGLSGLRKVDTSFALYSNSVLASLNGLQNLTSVSRITVNGSGYLTDLAGLSGVTGELWTLDVDSNYGLTSLNGLQGITGVTTNMVLWGSGNMQDLSALSGLTHIGTLELAHMDVQSLNGLDNVTAVTWQLNIHDNAHLSSLSALHPAALTGLANQITIHDNPQLLTCEIDTLLSQTSKTCTSCTGNNTHVCNCPGAGGDTDGDGTCDPADQCASDPAKTAPGACGCGVADTDGDGDGTPNCHDGCPSDASKTAAGACGCGVADTDSDGDGTANCNDGCPSDAAKIAAGACGCGTSDADGDSDGTPDCHDGCATDPSKVAAGACGCGVSDADSDSDGTPNCNDGCPSDASKIAAGACGCGVSDADSDSDGTPNCHDGCPADANKIAAGVCGCGTSDTDSDNDGTPNCNDACPNDASKIAAGACGCGVADTDSDNDGTANCHDACPDDANKIAAGACGCGTSDTDSDSDGTPNCHDDCPNDAGKIAAGACGCGTSDADSDTDGTPNCNDGCPNDANKTAAGACGCGIAETDSDSDGTPNCNDGCPSDANKVAAGACGCGVAETDSDSDGTPNCNDGCPSDANKIAAGACGCGVTDADSDNDGTADCNDGCPNDANKLAAGVCGCGVSDVDSDGNGVPDCHNACPDGDSDSDGVCDNEDRCPAGPDADDADDDTVPDACDLCPGMDDHADADGDLVTDGCTVLRPTTSLPITAVRASAADANADGRPDILAMGQSPNGLFLNQGNFQFSAQPESTSCSSIGPRSVDFDGDGILDNVGYGPSGTNIYLCYGDASGGMTLSALLSSDPPEDVAFADVNGDGTKDIVLDDWTGFLIIEMKPAPQRGTAAIHHIAGNRSPWGVRQIELVDVDGDGTSEIFIRVYDGELRGYEYASGGGYQLAGSVATVGKEIAFGDVDGDGRVDLVTTTEDPLSFTGNSTDIALWRGVAPGTSWAPFEGQHFAFADSEISPAPYVGQWTRSLTAVELGGGVGKEVLLQNDNGLFVFTYDHADHVLRAVQRIQGHPDSTSGHHQAVADFNGDGRTDVVQVAGTSLHVLRNVNCGPGSPDSDGNGIPDDCDTPTAAECLLGAAGPGVIIGDVTVGTPGYSQPVDIETLRGIRCVSGSLSIRETDLTDLDALSSLQAVGSHFEVLGNTQLTNLHGLESLTTVGYTADISNNAMLTSVQGLESLTSVGGPLEIYENPVLASLSALSSLTSVGSAVTDPMNGTLYILDNPALPGCAVWPIAKTTGQYCGQPGNPDYSQPPVPCSGNTGTSTCGSLPADFACVPGATGPGVYDGDIHIGTFNDAVDIHDLGGLTCVTGNLYITGSDVTDLTGLSHLQAAGRLEVVNDAQLTSLDGLQNLTTVTQLLGIGNNPQLSSLAALSNLSHLASANTDPTSMTLIVYDNAALPGCSIWSIAQKTGKYCGQPAYSQYGFDYPAIPCSGNTGTGTCGSLPAGFACVPGAIGPGVYDGDIHIGSWGDAVDIHELGGLTCVTGNLYINGSDLTDLTGLSHLQAVGALGIGENAQLTSLNGLQNLKTDAHWLGITDNPQLGSLDALSNLTSLGPNIYENAGTLYIADNAALTSCSTWPVAQKTGQFCGLPANPDWGQPATPCSGNTGTQTCGSLPADFACVPGASGPGVYDGDINIGIGTGNERVDIADLGGLTCVTGHLLIEDNDITDLSAFSHLQKVGGWMGIGGQQLTSLDGLQNLTSIGLTLNVAENPHLTSLAALSGLTSLGSANTDPHSAKLYIAENPVLSGCWIWGLAQKTGVSCGIPANPDYGEPAFPCSGNTGTGTCGTLPANFDCVAGTTGPGVYDGSVHVGPGWSDSVDIHELGGLTCVTGGLLIGGTAMTDLSALPHLQAVGVQLSIVDNAQLATLDGLQDLTTIGWALNIADNPQLGALSALSGLTSLGEAVDVDPDTIILNVNDNASLPACWADAIETQTGQQCGYSDGTSWVGCSGNDGSGSCE